MNRVRSACVACVLLLCAVLPRAGLAESGYLSSHYDLRATMKLFVLEHFRQKPFDPAYMSIHPDNPDSARPLRFDFWADSPAALDAPAFERTVRQHLERAAGPANVRWDNSLDRVGLSLKQPALSIPMESRVQRLLRLPPDVLAQRLALVGDVYKRYTAWRSNNQRYEAATQVYFESDPTVGLFGEYYAHLAAGHGRGVAPGYCLDLLSMLSRKPDVDVPARFADQPCRIYQIMLLPEQHVLPEEEVSRLWVVEFDGEDAFFPVALRAPGGFVF